MPNPWTGKGNPYTRKEVRDRLMSTIKKGDAIIAAGAGTGISAMFIEKGGADLLIIYNSGRFRMSGHGSTCGLMSYGDANAIAMEIGEYEVLPTVEDIPVICGVHATDPRRRMWHWLGKVKEMGFSGVNNFPTHTIVDGHFRGVLEETGMGVQKEFEMIALARKMDLFSIVYVATPEEAVEMAKAGADAIIAAGAGTGISAKFIEKGGADLLIIYNSGRFRMSGHGSTCGLMSYGDANAIAMEIGEYEVLPTVEDIPVICGVHATDPRRRMWHWLGKVKEMGFSGVNNFPTHTIVDGHFRGVLEETGMGVQKEFEMIALARKMDLFSIVYVATPEEAVEMAKAGADAIIAHVGTTVGGSIGVTKAVVTWDFTIKRTQEIIDAASRVRKDIFFLCHGGPINTPEDANRVMQGTDAVGFVGASSLERMGVEASLTNLTRDFKKLKAPGAKKFGRKK